ncbi:histidine phosphatase family protein [Streptomyces sp. NPDC004539]|uniref:histidine phosphatase family protein n=1 Tax=Streptomyces sp. NPDC004539 TaxID=3154280 RepID=UPI0033ACD0A6
MPTRHVYAIRHGAANAFGELTGAGELQSDLIGRRLAALPVDTVWHSPLPRAAHCARLLAAHLPSAPVREAPELVDHIPCVPSEAPPAWAAFFDGYGPDDAADARRRADALTARFARPAGVETHEVLVTHAYPIAWLVRDALDAPPVRWLGLESGNTALTVLQYRDGVPPTLVGYNDMGHLPAELRWTGFGPGTRP